VHGSVACAEDKVSVEPGAEVLLEELTVTQPVMKFPAFYGIQKFITVFTTNRHWSVSWARCIQSTPTHCISLRPTLILSSHLLRRLPLHVLNAFTV